MLTKYLHAKEFSDGTYGLFNTLYLDAVFVPGEELLKIISNLTAYTSF
jgi:hypothetical protein